MARLWRRSCGDNPGGGLVSSVADQLRWARFHLGDGRAPGGIRVLPAKVLQRIRQPTVALRASTLGDAMGIGWFLREVDGVGTVGHGGSEVRRSVSGQRILYWSTGASDRLGGLASWLMSVDMCSGRR